ncbi:MAG TPA: translocation/assembly module TamB domain-containing protein [Steroidobacteraceae bacterium]|nr:translocation/assembly module TamB domain-containing protein [Steroidobacteraceae bacterium]
MRRAWRISAAVAGALLLLVVLLIAAAFLAGTTAGGRAAVERLTYTLSAGRVQLAGLDGSSLSQLTLAELTLRDRRGVWLTAQRVSLQWSPLALLRRELKIEAVHAARVNLERIPVSALRPTGSRASIPHIDVAQASIDRLKLAPQVAGRSATLAVRGGVHLRSLDDLAARFDAARIDGDGRYDLRLRFDRKRLSGTLAVHEPAGGPLATILGLPGLGALSATMTLDGLRSAEQVDVRIEAGALRARAQGRVDLSARTADITYFLGAPAMRPRPDLAWRRLASSGQWRGGLDEPLVDAHLDVEDLRLGAATLLGSAHLHLTGAAGALAAHGSLSAVRIPGPNPALLAGGPVAFDASMRLRSAARPIVFSATQHLFSLRGRALTAGARTLSLDVRLPDLEPIAALANLGLRGEARVKLGLSDERTGTKVDIDAEAARLAGTAIWAKALGDRASLQLEGLVGDRDIRIAQLKAAGRAWSASLNADVVRRAANAPPPSSAAAGGGGAWMQSLRAHWTLKFDNLSAWSSALAGQLAVSGKIQGSPNAMLTDMQLTSTLAVGGAARIAWSGVLHARGSPSGSSGSLRVGGVLDAAPLRLIVGWSRDSRGLTRVTVRQGNWKSVRVGGELSSGADFAKPRGTLRVTVGDLADFDRLSGLQLAGGLSAGAVFAPGDGGTHAELRCSLPNFRIDDFAVSAELAAAGPVDALALHLVAKMPDLRGAPASAVLTGPMNLWKRTLRLRAAAFEYRGQTARLLTPANLSFADGLSIDHLRLAVDGGVFELAGRLAPTLAMHAALHTATPALIDAFAPGLLSGGRIDASAELRGRIAAPVGEAHLTAGGLRVGDQQALGLPAVQLRGSARLDGVSAQIDARLNAGKKSALTLSGGVPLVSGGALALKIDGKLDVALASPMLEARGMAATGSLRVAATVSGDPQAPRFGGTISLAGGHLHDYGHGVDLENISAQLVGNQGDLQIKSFTAAASPGTISVTGRLGLLRPKIPLDLVIVAKNARPIASNLLTAILDAKLRVSGTAHERIDVAGVVDLRRTVIGIPNAMPPDVAVLDVRRRGQAPAAVGTPLVIGLDVTLRAPRQLLVQGRGLDAELGGELHLAGTTAVPLVSGGFELQRGSFTLAGNRLSFSSGRVSFNGAGLKHKIDPMLDFTAQTTTADVTATLRITGLADAPQFSFSSVPPLPPDEIMARLLFGANAQQLSALQAAQLGAAFASLSGVGGSALNPLAKLQRALGLDRLTVGSAARSNTANAPNTGTSIAAGRYLSKRVYLEAKQNTTGSSQVQVNVDLSKHLKLQTRLGNGTPILQGTTPQNDPGSSIGLKYQFEY